LPIWATVLVAAEAWGCKPWELAGGSPLVWFMRWMEYVSEVDKKRRGEGIYNNEVDDG